MGEIFPLATPASALPYTGERLTSAEGGQGEIEHLHRYFLARHHARGKDVLDVASGEGYGAALLAQVARRVIGVEIDAAAVTHAARAYPRENLRFLRGDACAIPLATASVDLVTSFETIEHFYDHETFLAEIKRVLRPGGMLILSTPDRDITSPANTPPNPYHVHELTRDELRALVTRHFRHMAAFAQRPLLGTALFADGPMPGGPAARGALPLTFEQRGPDRIEASAGLARATYLLVVAADSDLPELADSLFIRDGLIDPYLHLPRQIEAQRHWTEEAIGRLHAEASARQAELDRLRTVAEQTAPAAAERAQVALALSEWRLAASETEREALRALLDRTETLLDQAQAQREQAEERARLARPLPRPSLAARLRRRLRRRWQPNEAEAALLAIVRASELFDPAWYLSQHADVRALGMDAAEHYVRFGAAEGRDPGPRFSVRTYLDLHQDVAAAGLNALDHYERFGRAEGRALRAAMSGPTATPSHWSLPERRPRVLFVSGEPHTPGHAYRVLRQADAVRRLGGLAEVRTVAEAASAPDLVTSAHLLVLWRTEWGEAVAAVVDAARSAGRTILFDVDDLMVDPALARTDVIDGIRSQRLNEAEVARFYHRVQESMVAADFCSTTTQVLADHMHRWGKPVFVLPNSFDDATRARANLAARARRAKPSDGLLRLGYAGGSRTHQKDFAIIAGAVARFLRARPNGRLVLFRRETTDCLDVHEYPALAGLEGQIEWREYVPVAELPDEIARFDVNLAPLEVGNPFCEAKSELKFFEAALAGVASVCSPTAPFRAAIRDGETGLLAAGEDAWHDAICRLADDPQLRARLARAAEIDSIGRFGPEAQTERWASVLEQTLHRGRRAARAFALDLVRAAAPIPPLPRVPEHEIVRGYDRVTQSAVTVVVPLYNYAGFVTETLDSVKAQTLMELDLIVVDDRSTDDSLAVAERWLAANEARFGRAQLVRNRANSGLGLTRNVGFALAASEFVLPVDADNLLLPECAARCLAALRESGAAYAYPRLERFGSRTDLFGIEPYDPARLVAGNYIDAQALIRRAAWSAVGGYDHVRFGWEDYDFWCRLAERGLFGINVPERLGRYRVHEGSMLRTSTDLQRNKEMLVEDLRRRHPWSRVVSG